MIPRTTDFSCALLVAFLYVLEPRIQNLFHAAELGAPEVAHVVEALVDGRELRVHEYDHDADQRSIEQHRDADRQVKLLIRHHNKSGPYWR